MQRYNKVLTYANKSTCRYIQREPKLLPRLSENGGYLLSHKRSTIGVAELNDPVRNGKGWDLSAITT